MSVTGLYLVAFFHIKPEKACIWVLSVYVFKMLFYVYTLNRGCFTYGRDKGSKNSARS